MDEKPNLQGGIWPQVEAALSGRIVARQPVAGGDINEAWHVSLVAPDGTRRQAFVKTNTTAPGGMFTVEARGLHYLADAKAVRTPKVLAHDEYFLALEWIASERRSPHFDELLGRGLADLHRCTSNTFGLDHNNFIGRLAQDNRGSLPDVWPAFYGERRLRPQIDLATDAGLLPSSVTARLDLLCRRLPELTGPAEPPARLHGDLWSGNHLADELGHPVLVDPAVYAGHREVDLAMMRLFGGYTARVYDAYNEAYPLEPGHAQRVPLYQLYYLLVHVNLFGSAYVGRLVAALTALGF